MTGQQLITKTGMFVDEVKVWKILPAVNRMWTHFKEDFTLVHQELRENATMGNIVGQANNAAQDLSSQRQWRT